MSNINKINKFNLKTFSILNKIKAVIKPSFNNSNKENEKFSKIENSLNECKEKIK